MDINAAFKITAGVVGQQAVDKLSTGVAGLNKHVGALPGFAKAAGLAMAGLGAGLSFAVFKEKFDGVVESMLRVKDSAEKTGSTVENMGKLNAISRVTGDSFDLIESSIIKMDKALAGSDDTAKGAARALGTIGLNIADLRKMDPAEAFGKVAEKLNDFEDGAGKTAIAMDVFGKSGAQVLPFLKDYVELSDTVTKVTAEQAEAADQYDRNIRKLNAGKQELYKTISTALIPVANDFVKSLLDVSNGTNGVRQGAKDLAADGSIKSWATAAVNGFTYLLDAGEYVMRLFTAIGKTVGAAAAQMAAMFGGIADAMDKLKSGEFTAAWQAMKAGNVAADNIGQEWLKDMRGLAEGATLGSKLRDRFAANQAESAAGGPAKTAPKASLNGYTSRAPTDGGGNGGGGEKADPFKSAMNSMGAEAAKLQWQSDHIKEYSEKIDSAREATARFDVEKGKFADRSEAEKAQYIALAQQVDKYAEELRQAKVALEVTNQTKAIEANTAAMGLNTSQREMAAFVQDLENKGIKEGTQRFNELKAARENALANKDAATASPMMGMKQGLNELLDQSKDVAGQVKGFIVGAFDKSADALTDFVMTGKLNFKDFARSILADLTKMIVKQMLFNALKTMMSATGFGFAKGGAFDSAGGVQAFAAGGVVNTPTPFKFASGGRIQNGLMGEAGPEAIMPLKRGTDGKLGVAVNGGGSGGGVTIGSINVASDGTAAANDTSGKNADALGRQLAAAVQAEIIKQQRPGGLLAA